MYFKMFGESFNKNYLSFLYETSCWWAFWETSGEQKTCLFNWFCKYSQLPYSMLFYWYTLNSRRQISLQQAFLTPKKKKKEKTETRRWVHNTWLLWGRHSYSYSEVSAKQYFVFSVLKKKKTKFETSLYSLLCTKNISALTHGTPKLRKCYMGNNNKIPETYADQINTSINVVTKTKKLMESR